MLLKLWNLKSLNIYTGKQISILRKWEFTQIALEPNDALWFISKPLLYLHIINLLRFCHIQDPMRHPAWNMSSKSLSFGLFCLFSTFLIMEIIEQTLVSQHLDLRKVKYFKYFLAYFYYTKIQVVISEPTTQFSI